MYGIIYSDELYHHGVKGQKWGVRKQRKFDRKVYRSQMHDQRINAARERQRMRLARKYGDKSVHVKDFDQGTRFIKTGEKRYGDTIKNYAKAKERAANDKSYKSSDAYKKAKKAYNEQVFNNLMYGRGQTKLIYAMESAGKSNLNPEKRRAELKAEKKALKNK